jgi:dTDP-4-dehydrorhamnose 3,5-epimerase
MEMEAESTPLPGLIALRPTLIQDARGYFYEAYSPRVLAEIGSSGAFVQENVSGSHRGVLRGLHYQLHPASQGKLIRITRGEVFDAVVDLRRSSPTFGRWQATSLSAENRLCLWVPPGFAHGFCVVSEFAEMVYGVTAPYSPAHERTIAWNDPDIGICWPEMPGGHILSPKDQAGVPFRRAELDPSV